MRRNHRRLMAFISVTVLTFLFVAGLQTAGATYGTTQWFAGRAMVMDGRELCTTGPHVYMPFLQRYGMLTVEHCVNGYSTGAYEDTGNYWTSGDVYRPSNSADVAIIDVGGEYNQASSSLIFAGTGNGSWHGGYVRVVGQVEPSIGLRVCASGIVSGTVCGLIAWHGLAETDRGYTNVMWRVDVDYRTGTTKGDSGSAVFTNPEGNRTYILGVVNGDDGSGHTFYFTDLDVAQQATGVTAQAYTA